MPIPALHEMGAEDERGSSRFGFSHREAISLLGGLLTRIKAIEWSEGKLRLLDQTRLPAEQVILELTRCEQVVAAIGEMRVRGAPALGVTAAYALAMAAQETEAHSRDDYMARLCQAADAIVAARPTAVNVGWAVKGLLALAGRQEKPCQVPRLLLSEAQRLQRRDGEANRALGAFGARLMPEDGGVLTHCNTGALATAGYGTALGIIRAAWEQGKRFKVFHTETRPFLQGARLTAWELQQLGIPATLVVDSAAGFLMGRGEIGCVVLGADRIAANGDTANKIGTYTLAVLAHENGIPFYVAAPTSTVDLSVASGEDIPIEERPAEEVTAIAGVPTAPHGVNVWNPAFDVTPHRYVSAIITEKGIVRPPYALELRRVVQSDG